MIFGIKKVKELEALYDQIFVNASNNYKDEAQQSYRDFLVKLEEYQVNGLLSEKQKNHYQGYVQKLKPMLEKYTHFDQRPDVKGLSELIKKVVQRLGNLFC